MKSLYPINFLKTVFVIFLSSFVLQFGYSQISIIGSATPATDWETDFDLNQDLNNLSIWKGEVILQKDLHFKFRANHDWNTNWGSATFPSGSLVPDGENIMVDITATYLMTFDSTALTYEFVVVPIPSIIVKEDGRVGIGVISPNESAKLEIESTSQGFLPPRMTQAQRNSIVTPIPAGLVVWCNNCGLKGELQVYNGVEWTHVNGGIASNIPFTSIQMGLDIDGEAAGDQSGYSVSLSADGTRLAIGARYNDDNGASSGHVRVYEWDGSPWVQVGIDIVGEAAGDFSGFSVSISADGMRLAIGALGNDDNGAESGHVRVYEWGGSSWDQMGIDIDGEAAFDESGFSVSLSADGTRVAIGARGNDDNGAESGHVRVYEWNGSSWIQMGIDIVGEAAGDESGYSVSLSADGTRLAIGGRYNDDNGAASGHVRVYKWSSSSWGQMGMDIDGEAAGDLSGYSVSLSSNGTRLAIGAPANNDNGTSSGQVRIYEWDGSVWSQLGIDIDGEAADDFSGYLVSLSADGTRVAIGAQNNDGNGSNSGHVRIYEWDGSSWGQLGIDIDGEAAGDQSGSVSLSADGTRLAIGAIYNDGNGLDSGHVHVYQ